MLEELKKEVLRVSRLAEETGLCHHGGGNFSQIDRESGLVVITPHAESRYNFNAEDMLVVDLDGNIIENRKNFTPSSETPMHLLIYKEREDASVKVGCSAGKRSYKRDGSCKGTCKLSDQ